MLEETEHRALLIRGGRVIDPVAGRDEVADVAIADGAIVDGGEGAVQGSSLPSASLAPDAAVIEAAGWIVCPGFWDLHVHLREPGHTEKESIETGTAAAAAGGFTFVACMPNTRPAIDNPGIVRLVIDRARAANCCVVGPVAAITKDRAGAELTDFASLLKAGAVAFSDDGNGVENNAVMRAAFQRAKALGAVLIQHCEYRSISSGGVMHAGDVSRRLGFPGLDPRSEEAMIERDIALCREIGGRYHVAHISTARAIEMVRRAKTEGLAVTAEVCTHHLILTDEACSDADPNTKMHPPLRLRGDVDACRRGLLDGTIDCIATDHAPHTAAEKSAGFLGAPPGIVGLETAVGLADKAMVESGLADWAQLVAWFSTGPAAVLGRSRPRISPGAPAELTLISPNKGWVVEPERFVSKARNTPFGGWRLRARVRGTVRGTRVVLDLGSSPPRA